MIIVDWSENLQENMCILKKKYGQQKHRTSAHKTKSQKYIKVFVQNQIDNFYFVKMQNTWCKFEQVDKENFASRRQLQNSFSSCQSLCRRILFERNEFLIVFIN